MSVVTHTAVAGSRGRREPRRPYDGRGQPLAPLPSARVLRHGGQAGSPQKALGAKAGVPHSGIECDPGPGLLPPAGPSLGSSVPSVLV